MRKILVSLLALLFLLPLLSAPVKGLDIAEVEDKISSIAHYAEEYEVGNINYFQLNVYGHRIRSDLNLLLGGGIGEEWARIPKESVEKAFGSPTDYTTWIWVDNKHMNKRLDEAMPSWERIVFDGRKVRIVFTAFPSAIELENGEMFKYYSVDLNVRFKKKFDFDLDSILSDIKSLTADYNMTRTKKSGETLIKKILDSQRLLGSYVQENSEQCVETLESLFEPEERWPEQKMMTWKFSLYRGSDFDLMTSVDMCDECEWHHLNVWFMVEGRGPMFIFKLPELRYGKLEQQVDEEYYQSLSIDEVNQELKKTIFEMRDEAEKFDKTRSEDFPKKFFFNRFKVMQLNRILDGKYNGVENFDSSIARRIESGELQGPGGCKNLDECRKYCSNQVNRDECRKFTYELRVDFNEKMFSGYDIEKTPSDQSHWERVLFENSAINQNSWCRHVNDLQCNEDEGCANGKCVLAKGGNETCDNKKDDDGDNVVDCQDPDCWQERRCGKLCEDTCNREGGCWQTSQKLCSSVCKECWKCEGDEEKCKNVCEKECWPCHEQEEIKNACDDCWSCEDEAYGGCYNECKSCDKCNIQRKDKIKAIFNRAAQGEIKTPGGCMTEEECNKYCAEHGEECSELMSKIGLWSEELDCTGDCKECTVCNHDLGNFKCNHKQHLDRDNGYCVCDEGWYDCDGDWNNGCEANKPCGAGPCFEECKDCDACKEGEEKCKDVCLGCHKCRNPDMPTYICNGVEQLKPCETEYVCNGVKQKKPCEIYICNGREYNKPCHEVNVTCGKNQLLLGNDCVCEDGFKDCDSDGNCEATKFCGLEICDNGKDDNSDGLTDCNDQKCDRQICGIENGKKLLCISKRCIPPEEERIPIEPIPICGNHVCETGEDEKSCKEDCIVCEVYEPPDCPNGKIVWKGKDNSGCQLPPICVVTEKACESNEDCPQPKCGVALCISGECKVTELRTDCKEGCKEGKTKIRDCKDGSTIVTAVCSANQWVETGYDCPEAPPKAPPKECPPTCAIFCEHGNKLDERGCPTCECNPPPVKENVTEEKQEAKQKENVTEEKQEVTPKENVTEKKAPENITEEKIPEVKPKENITEEKITENVTEQIVPEEKIPEAPEEIAPPVEEKAPAEAREEIAPEVEKEAPKASNDCEVMGDCGGSQDVCSNGNCVTLPIPVEEKAEKKAPEEKHEEKPVEEKIQQEKQKELPQETQAEKSEKSEKPSEESQGSAQEQSPTGSMIADATDFMTQWLTGLFAEESTCSKECTPCDECNQAVDKFMKRIEAGEFAGPNNCKSRVECDNYCQTEEHKQECNSFFQSYGLKTFYCWWDFCRECDKCKFKIGEFTCNANQQFNMEQGFCECSKGWYECDGDWENGCESQQQCGGCQSKDDCADDRCAPWGNVVQQFDCFKGEQWLWIQGAVRIQGDCRFLPTKKIEGWVGFDMWGEPFEALYPIKEQMERELGWEWCGWDMENNIRERLEIQSSFTEETLRWFFEEYVPSDPSQWEKHIGGIYDSYWRIVNNNEWTAETLLCLGEDKLPEEYKPIDVRYDTEFGSVRIWEVEKTTDFFGKRMRILSPYMQIWVFPPKEFVKKQFQEAMEAGTMPGPGENKKPELSPAEIEEMKKDKKFMDLINSLSSKYGGEAKFLLNIVDQNETVFNALITINPENLVKIDVAAEGDYDAKITFDFDFFYSLIATGEKEVSGGQIVYPPWEQEGLKIGDAIKGVVDGVKMWYMINSGVASGSIRAEPSDALSDGLTIMRFMFERGPQ